MFDVTLNYTNLAPIFILDKSLEQTPDPFRLQGHKVTFIVPFDEYKNFIRRCLRSVDYLSTPTSRLKTMDLSSDETGLYKCYMRDMAIAVCKELHYAESVGGNATVIKHSSDADKKYTLDEVVNINRGADAPTLRAYMEAYDYKLPKNFSSTNYSLWMYANMLFKASREFTEEWEVDIK